MTDKEKDIADTAAEKHFVSQRTFEGREGKQRGGRWNEQKGEMKG